MKIITSGMTDVGCVRRSNEDSLGLFHDLKLYIVADGMGGHAAGEVASKMAVDQIKAFFSSPETEDGGQKATRASLTNEERLKRAISYANKQIFLAGARDPAHTGMGTTVVSLLVTPEESVVGYIGDSRLYLIQGGHIQQLTQDHSMVNEYVQKGLITAEAAENHPQKHVLSRAMGTGLEVAVATFTRKTTPGDTYLLCSDGLSNKLRASEMCDIIRTNHDLSSAGKQLIQRAIAAGGEDNITVLLVAYVE